MQKELAKREKPAGLAVSDIFDRWFNDVFSGSFAPLSPTTRLDWQPRVDINENDKEIMISASVPGVDKNDIAIEVTDHTLTIEGERKEMSEQKESGYVRREQVYGRFARSFQLPENVNTEGIKANNKNGVLQIHLPKTAESKPKGKKISVE
jgi:HSP20 family protein